MSSDHATVAEEEYLQTIFWLHEAGLPMTGANVARAMQLSAPTVHEMLGRLERDGYITRGADKAISFTDSGREHAEGSRPPSPAHRALPDRRARHPLGRGPRGGRAARARDEPGARGAHAGGDRRRQDVPARPPDRGRHAHRGRPACRRRGRRERARRALRERGRGPAPLPDGDGASSPAWRARSPSAGADEVVVDAAGRRVALTASVAETVSVKADPSPPPRVSLPEQLVIAAGQYGR